MNDGINILFGEAPSASSGTRVPSVRSVSLSNWPLSSRRGKISFNISLGAKSKGSNGGVAVGLPHRNSSVFKQALINQWKVKRIDPPSAVGGLKGNNSE